MKIVVNVSSLLGSLNGIGFYTMHLLDEMLLDPRYADIQGIGGRRWFDRDQLRQLVARLLAPEQRVTQIGAQRPVNARRSLFGKLPGSDKALRHWMAVMVRRHRGRLHDYLYWEPNYILLPHLRPAITTVHDLSHLVYPQFHPPARVRYLVNKLADSIHQSRHVITVSAFSLAQISAHFGIDKGRISIVPPAVTDAYRLDYSPAALQTVRERYRLPENFILSVGTMEPRKNLHGLMLAHQQLDPALQSRYPLLIVGSSGWKLERSERLMRQMIDTGKLMRLGFVPEDDMPALYKLATLLAYPSFFEGFGMPIAEAMAAGAPVLTSDRAAMPETTAGVAQFVNPDSVDSIEAGLNRMLQDPDYRDSLRARGREVAAAYTWQSSATALSQLLRNSGQYT